MRYIAFLRAINVGGHVVKMDKLRALFEEMGFKEVSTFIASGNVLFDSKLNAAKIEQIAERELETALGYPVATFVRTAAEVQKAVDDVPFDASELEGARLYVGFLKKAPAPELRQRLIALSNDNDVLRVVGREVYWLSHSTFADSTLSGALIEKTLGGPATQRNITMLRKLSSKS